MLEDLKKPETVCYSDEKWMNAPLGKPIKTGCAVKNPNIEIIKQIENFMNVALTLLDELNFPRPRYLVNLRLKAQALEEIDLFQRTTLHELRKAYE